MSPTKSEQSLRLITSGAAVLGPPPPPWSFQKYDGAGKIFAVAADKKKVPFVITIPLPGGSSPPTGVPIVFNEHDYPPCRCALRFSTENGIISGWQRS